VRSGENCLFGNKKQKQFETIFGPHLDSSYNLARYLCGNTFDAEDIVQEVYIKAYRAFDSYANTNSRAWILSITRNTFYSWLRKNKLVGTAIFDDALTVNADENALYGSTALSPEYLLESIHDQQHVWQAIQTLPHEFREVIILREFEEMSYQEITDVLGLPQGTVMSRLARARKRLRDLLSDKMQEESL
jgi:RNA polymerase sigma factor (sigma-70 family)